MWKNTCSSFPAILLIFTLLPALSISKVHIYVTNSVPSDSPNPVTTHCQSRDDDLGYHTLHVNQYITWSFHPSLGGSTLFFCHLWWGDKNVAFNAYEEKRFCVRRGKLPWQIKSNTCYWESRADGIYFNKVNDPNDSPSWVKNYPWTVSSVK
ncbi:hypothetical protein DCAR_0208476 [Daucus carota subsp. sativus]|uniref:S-protein homolog n=1 Tax=Daucus carota subsp. sativus TaxID=79200 RepID=A0AAF0WGG3_DAUCS|nr:hypothetical protein DCAR_0208476 [Daucus carota subsp. sativus]